jgi:hypothetical protein
MTTIEQARSQANVDQAMQPGAGSLGLSRRSYERLYYNATRALGNVDYFVNRMAPWAEERVVDSSEHQRIVGRILMTESQLFEVLQRSEALQRSIEVAIPVGEYLGSPMMMTMWGINNNTRQTLVDIPHIVRETEYLDMPKIAPITRVDALRNQGYAFVDSADFVSTEQIFSLWGPIFEWPQHDINALRSRLSAERTISPVSRSVWFSAIMYNSDVVSLAMAERLNLPLGGGDYIPIIESTEWCVRPAWQQRGLGVGAISHVHAQVFRDLSSHPRQPIVVAETNFTSRADRLGHSAGMVVGDREINSFFVPQILRQNVAVSDGIRSDRLRDFTMMYIPPENIARYYSNQQCEHITGRFV